MDSLARQFQADAIFAQLPVSANNSKRPKRTTREPGSSGMSPLLVTEGLRPFMLGHAGTTSTPSRIRRYLPYESAAYDMT